MTSKIKSIEQKGYPKPLSKNSHLRVIAPSCSGKTVNREQLIDAKKVLEESGYKISFGENLFKFNSLQSSSIQQRVSDFHEAFADPDVDGIIAIRGGYNANDLLDYIDWELIGSHPKVYCGFSDNTVIENAILAKTGFITYSGPNFATFGKSRGRDYTLTHFLTMVRNQSPLQYEEKCNVINPGNAEGKIVGGNLCSFNLLQGTQYMPSLDNTIIFLEDDFISEYDWWEFSRNLQSLINLTNFNKVQGIVIGKFDPKSNLPLKRIREIIKSKPALDKVPILSGISFGHISKMITFPIGGYAKITTGSKERLLISIK